MENTSKNISERILVRYIRKNNTLIGCLVAVDTGTSIGIGWSKCRKGDTFNKKIAKKIAIGRANAFNLDDFWFWYDLYVIKNDPEHDMKTLGKYKSTESWKKFLFMPATFKVDFLNMIDRARRYFKKSEKGE